MAADTQVDLANCETEPIRLPGSIQPHGVLLAVDETDWRVAVVSRNAEELLGRAVRGPAGRATVRRARGGAGRRGPAARDRRGARASRLPASRSGSSVASAGEPGWARPSRR